VLLVLDCGYIIAVARQSEGLDVLPSLQRGRETHWEESRLARLTTVVCYDLRWYRARHSKAVEKLSDCLCARISVRNVAKSGRLMHLQTTLTALQV
jgi:hypothetical protein